MAYTASNIQDIIRSGCAVIISSNGFTAPQLQDMARTAKGQGKHLTIKVANSFTVTQLQDIARAGSGHVTLELS